MGCFASKKADTKASRTARWRSTGIVALRDSKLKAFPDEILDLDTAVCTLDSTHNRIVGQLVWLKHLSISGNLLTTLPATIGSLRNLLLLNVSNNKLKSLPESVGSCFSLEEIQANDTSGSIQRLQSPSQYISAW